jgi:MOSC domain-containing protein YiiM
MSIVKNIKISKIKKQPKTYLEKGYFRESYGLEGDIHSGSGERQISILAAETREKIKKEKLDGLCTAKFDENIETEGIELYNYPVGTKLKIGEAEIEISEVGKKCYKECPIIKEKQTCILSRECIFAKVIKSGWVTQGDRIEEV